MSALTFAANKFPESLEVDMAQDSDGDVMVINGEDFPLSQAPMEITLNPKTDKEGKIQEKYKKDKGKFFIEELSEAEEVLYLIPVAEIRRSRAYFEAYNKGENTTPLCRSFDGENPDPHIEGGAYAEKCGTYEFGKARRLVDFQPECQHAKWGEGGVPPKCSESVQVAFLDARDGSLLEMEFKRTSYGPYMSAISALVKKQKALRNKRRDSHDLILKAVLVDHDKYYAPAFEVVKASDEGLENPVKFLPLRKWYLENVIEEIRKERTTPRKLDADIEGEMEVVGAAKDTPAEDTDEEGAGFSL